MSAPTISRELKRNTGERGYRYQQADNKATERRRVASSCPKRMTMPVIHLIEEKLIEKWSPEQIAGTLRASNMLVSYETIYRHVWTDKKKGGVLHTHLRRRGKKYNRRSAKTAGRGCIPNRVDITERPKIVEEKSRLGDWEGDTIIGAKQQGVIMSLVDRKSKFTLLAKIKGKYAKQVPGIVKSVT